MKKLIWILFPLFGLAMCKNKLNNPETVIGTQDTVLYYGDSISAEGVLTVADVMNQLKTTDSINCAVKGFVTGVCKVKGCWMTLANTESDTNVFFVRFKDYAFFVPKELSGEVVVRGIAYKEITSVDDLKHYAEDEGKSEEEIEAITQPLEEMKIMATGVRVETKNQ